MIELLNIDCVDYMKGLEDNGFDLSITDPPYNLGRKYNGNYNDDREDYEQWCSDWFQQLERIVKGTIIFSCGVKNIAMWHRIKEPVWQWLWFKGNNMGSGSKYTSIGVWEPFLIYGDCKRLGVDGKYLPIVPQYDASFHDCPKPLRLIKHIIKEVSNPGDKIIDPFLGSGTTAIAAHSMGFDFVGCEIDKDYYEAACKRFKEQTMQQKLFI